MAEVVHLDAVIDDEFGGQQRIDARGIAAEAAHGVAHGGEIDDGGHAGEVLHQHPGRREGDFFRGDGLGVPLRQGDDVLGADGQAVLGAQQVFQEDLEGERQALGGGMRLVDGVEPEEGVVVMADAEFARLPRELTMMRAFSN